MCQYGFLYQNSSGLQSKREEKFVSEIVSFCGKYYCGRSPLSLGYNLHNNHIEINLLAPLF